MNISLNSLSINKEIIVDEIVEKDDDLDKRIIDLKDSKVTGKVYINSLDEIEISLNFIGTMIIKDSITLKDIPYNFNIDIEELLDNINDNYDNVYDISKNTLDLKGILWQNIVLEVPISYTIAKDAKLKGNGWELVSENESREEVDPRLKKLEDLLKGDD